MKHRLPALLVLLALCWSAPVLAEDYQPTSYGLATLNGRTKAPEEIGISILQLFALFDYQRIAGHPAPDNLRLRLEGNLGITNDGHDKTFASINALGVYYLEPLVRRWHPYIEAGIGVIYTEFRLRGQDYNLNFNPQFGVGLEYRMQNGSALQGGARFHHISNASLGDSNRGVDTMLLMLGWHY